MGSLQTGKLLERGWKGVGKSTEQVRGTLGLGVSSNSRGKAVLKLVWKYLLWKLGKLNSVRQRQKAEVSLVVT